MPENLNKYSFLHEEIKNHPQWTANIDKIGSEVELRTADYLGPYGFERVIKEVGKLQQTVEKRYPNYPPEKMATMFNLVFNFLQLKPDSLRSSDQRIDKYERELSARISHTFVHHMIDAGYEDADPQFVEAMYGLYRNGLWVNSFINRNLSTTNLSALWRGIQNETAVAKTLMGADYAVYVPDYTQDIGDDEDMEVLQLDVKSAIDMIAVSPNNHIFLLDITGARTQEIQTRFSSKPQIRKSTNSCVRNAIVDIAQKNGLIDAKDTQNLEELNSLQIIQTTIALRGGGKTIEPPDPTFAINASRMHKILGEFGNQKLAERIALTDSLDRLERHPEILPVRSL